MWKQTSMQRLSFSDLSNPQSPRFAEDLSFSLGSNICVFTTNELRSITNNYSSSYLLGEGGFGPVYKGFIDEKLKQREGADEDLHIYVAKLCLPSQNVCIFGWAQAEVIYLGQLKHEHLVKLIGYCCEEEQMLLVYEFMARGYTRMSAPIPDVVGQQTIHIRLPNCMHGPTNLTSQIHETGFHCKAFGLWSCKRWSGRGRNSCFNQNNGYTRLCGTRVCYDCLLTPSFSGHLTAKSDVYSFGVVLLELLTGLRAMDKNRHGRQQNLVDWKRPYLLYLCAILVFSWFVFINQMSIHKLLKTSEKSKTMACLEVQEKVWFSSHIHH
ncbi:Serine/threonine-protein kinase [Nymphaea thermarum]|nr:Serine/threonine-protein kinase [Nymphaea thermarum]